MARRNILLATLSIVLAAAGGSALAASPGPRPDHAFQLRLGGFFPDGGGDLWTDNEEVFTLSVSDLDDFTWGVGYVHPLGNRFELAFNLDWYGGRSSSRYRDYLDNAGFPIVHDTYLDEAPLTLDVRWFPAGRYGTLSGGRFRLRPAFYLLGGAGANFWSYEEVGDFILFDDPGLPIVPARYKDSGVAFQTQLGAGIELPVNPHFQVVLEGRYAWSDDTLHDDFAGFGRIELGGTSLFAGAAFRF